MLGWFPFLFYITTYIGELYASPHFAAHPNMTDEEIDRVWQEGTRVATGALFIFAITSFVASVVLPMLVASAGESPTSCSTLWSGVGDESSLDMYDDAEIPATVHSDIY